MKAEAKAKAEAKTELLRVLCVPSRYIFVKNGGIFVSLRHAMIWK